MINDQAPIVEENTYYYIQNVQNDTVFEVENGNTSNRTILKHRSLKPDAYYQQFKLTQQNDGSVFIQPRHTNSYVYHAVFFTCFMAIYDLNANNSKFHFKLLLNADGSFRIAVGYFSYSEILHADSNEEVSVYLGSGGTNWRLVKADTSNVAPNDKSMSLGANKATKSLNFTPAKTGYYMFETSGSYDTYIEVYQNGKLLKSFDDTGVQLNAKTVNLIFEQGITYVIEFRMYSSSSSGIVGFRYTYSAASSSDLNFYVNGTTHD